MISLSPSTLISSSDDLVVGQSFGHLIQCPEDPYLIVDQRYNTPLSLYFMTTEEGFRLIDGTPIENITIVYSLENITEYSGFIDLQEPGLYLLFITASNQSEDVYSYISVLRGVPQFRVLSTGLVFLLLGILTRYYPFPKLVQLLKREQE
jgi:hypothetical protein